MQKNEKKLIKLTLEYGIHIWLIIVTLNLILIYSVHFFIIAATCMTTTQVATDSRCLYIWGKQIYQIGSHTSPHHGHSCGTDVTSSMPSSHLGNQASYLLPNYIANICPAAPTPTPLPNPTNTPAPHATTTPTPKPNPTATPLPQATSTPPPTPTIPPNATIASFTLLLQGLGRGGDGSNPIAQGNMMPTHPQRTFTLEVFDNNNFHVLTTQGVVTFDSKSGYFKGNTSLGTSLKSGAYSMRVTMHQFLRKIIPGIQNLQASKTNTIQTATLVTGDIDNDNVLSVLDYNLLMNCYSDLLPAATCTDPNKQQAADLNDDGNVNQFDYNLFFRELSFRAGD